MKLRLRAEAANSDAARALTNALVAELEDRYGAPDDPDGLASHELSPPSGVFLVAYLEDNDAVGCGGIRRFDAATGEVKRMYVLPDARRQGVAAALVRELEVKALGLGYERLRLEIGLHQPEAIALYEGFGYERIESYGVYADSPLSVCLEKQLPHA
jgi:GNAT superfamily N-acetyltransferase